MKIYNVTNLRLNIVCFLTRPHLLKLDSALFRVGPVKKNTLKVHKVMFLVLSPSVAKNKMISMNSS